MARGVRKSPEERLAALDAQIEKLTEAKETFQAKIEEAKKQKQAIQDEVKTEKLEEMAKILESTGLSVDDAIKKLTEKPA